MPAPLPFECLYLILVHQQPPQPVANIPELQVAQHTDHPKMPNPYAQIILFVPLLSMMSISFLCCQTPYFDPSFVVKLPILLSTYPWRQLTVRAENAKTDTLSQLPPLDTLLIFPFSQQCYLTSQSLHLGHSSYRAIISWGLAAASILVHYCGLSPQSPILYFTSLQTLSMRPSS
jgi:hypothetical protein